MFRNALNPFLPEYEQFNAPAELNALDKVNTLEMGNFNVMNKSEYQFDVLN